MSLPSPAAAARPARTRISFLQVDVVLLCTALVGWTGTRAISAAVTTPPKPGASAFASYVDVTATPTYPFETRSGPAQSNVILSFVVAGPDHHCTPEWGGVYTLDQASSRLDLGRRISQLRLIGGQARVSFGGQAGSELATTCTDPVALRGAYQSVVDRYALTSIDLDIEGASLDDTAAATRRAVAVRGVQDRVRAAGHRLAVWLTLPVSQNGLTTAGISVVGGDSVSRRRPGRGEHGLRLAEPAGPAPVQGRHPGLHGAARPGLRDLHSGRPDPRRRRGLGQGRHHPDDRPERRRLRAVHPRRRRRSQPFCPRPQLFAPRASWQCRAATPPPRRRRSTLR